MQTLGLFPLNTVLMPGATLRLHIFEDRYKRLIGECIARARPFGVVLSRSGAETGDDVDPARIGTLARISAATKLATGRMYIVTRGTRRFEVVRFRHDAPYANADVRLLDDEDDADDALRDAARDRFRAYIATVLELAGRSIDDVDLPADPPSFLIADTLRVDAAVKQRLLEIDSDAKRLHAEIELLKEQTAALRRVRPRRFADTVGQSKRGPLKLRFSRN